MDQYICTIDGDYNESCVLKDGNITDCDIAIKIKKEGGNCSWCKYFVTREVYNDRIEQTKQKIKEIDYNYKLAKELQNEVLENDIKLLNYMTTIPEKVDNKKRKNEDKDDDCFSFW